MHAETRGEPITVSESPLLITAVPEGGTLVPNLENQVLILTLILTERRRVRSCSYTLQGTLINIPQPTREGLLLFVFDPAQTLKK